jgi:hypothetical protein
MGPNAQLVREPRDPIGNARLEDGRRVRAPTASKAVGEVHSFDSDTGRGDCLGEVPERLAISAAPRPRREENSRDTCRFGSLSRLAAPGHVGDGTAPGGGWTYVGCGKQEFASDMFTTTARGGGRGMGLPVRYPAVKVGSGPGRGWTVEKVSLCASWRRNGACHHGSCRNRSGRRANRQARSGWGNNVSDRVHLGDKLASGAIDRDRCDRRLHHHHAQLRWVADKWRNDDCRPGPFDRYGSR